MINTFQIIDKLFRDEAVMGSDLGIQPPYLSFIWPDMIFRMEKVMGGQKIIDLLRFTIFIHQDCNLDDVQRPDIVEDW